MDVALYSRKKGFSICQCILEANKENLLELRLVKYALRVKPVHPMFSSDECNLMDCKGIRELVLLLWQWSKTLDFYSLELKSAGFSLSRDLTYSTSWNRLLKGFACHDERLAFQSKLTAEKTQNFFSRSDVFVFLNGLFVCDSLKKSETIILHYQCDHHCVTDGSLKYQAGLDPDHHYTTQWWCSCFKGVWLMTLMHRFGEGESCVLVWPWFFLR